MVEYGWADAFRKPIITLMKKDGIYEHPFINELSGFIAEDIKEAVEIIKNVLLP